MNASPPSSPAALAAPRSTTLGWREWVGLPDLGIDAVKCKVDTGARSSALHAFQVERFTRDGSHWVRFGIHPHQHDNQTEVWCEAPVLDVRNVTDSGGHSSERYFIATQARIGDWILPLELSLTSRDTMLFRMLLGREAMRGRFLVDPQRSFVLGRPAGIPATPEQDPE
ncbi:ATP-dependent zinc protease [Thioalkalivibrio sp. ALJT]|uniref:ATP-dependent zinc protease family protein n=1 Tax=Thioalkalivibrio sp. ALJT TaxID=1158146 RepID=UPI0005709041|nr:ATP-dependent zinc protease [Thioalkalivibrio sp. ALJT]